MTKCTLCRHKRVAYVDSLVAGGARSLLSIAKECGIPYSVVRRHVASGHAVRQAAPSAPPKSPPPPGSSPAAELRHQLDGLNATDASAMSPSARIALFDAKRRTAEALAKSTPPPSEDDADVLARYIRHPAVQRFEAEIFDALEPWPEARRALAEVVRKRLAAARVEEEST
jgi:hypothetical protein